MTAEPSGSLQVAFPHYHPHYTFCLYDRLPAHGNVPSTTRPPPDTLDITARLSGSFQVAFPQYLPLAARPPLTHILQPPRVPSSYTVEPLATPQTTPSPHLSPSAAWPTMVPGIGYNWKARLLRTAAPGGVAPPGPGACDGPGIFGMAPAPPPDSPAALGPLRPARSPAPP